MLGITKMNTFQSKTKRSFKAVKQDMGEFKGKTEKWLLFLLQRVRELESKVEQLENAQKVSVYK